MATWERVHVDADFTAASRRERQGGSYLRYHPDLLCSSSNVLDGPVLERAAEVSTALARLGARLAARPLPILYATTLRSESISSSWIEGIRATPRDVAVAQLGSELATHTASQVVRNVEAMSDAVAVLGTSAWTHDHLWDIHHALLPWHARGYRTDQVWVGGSHKLNADYAGPPAERVRMYMDDLLDYVNTSGELPVVLAALAHAQFETVHPFADGNGRVGRALVHGVLRRAGLVDGGVIPLSTALRKDVAGYVAALTRYRYDGTARAQALSDYVDRFLGFLETATVSAHGFADAATALHDRWRAAVAGVRDDSALHRALDLVIENPVVTAGYLAQRLQVSTRTAESLVRQLQDASILSAATGKYRRAPLYQSDEILALLAYGGEAGPRTPPPALAQPAVLIERCGAAT